MNTGVIIVSDETQINNVKKNYARIYSGGTGLIEFFSKNDIIAHQKKLREIIDKENPVNIDNIMNDYYNMDTLLELNPGKTTIGDGPFDVVLVHFNNN